MKFLVDMPLSPALAAWLRKQGHDAVHADEIGLSRSADSAILAHASTEHRTVITADLDYPRLLAIASATNPSLILFRDGDWSDTQIVARMEEILQAVTPNDIIESILVVDRDRVRRRRLPIGR